MPSFPSWAILRLLNKLFLQNTFRMWGFTLIELVVFILIAGIMAIVFTQAVWDNTGDVAKVRACAESLKANLKYYQSQAKTQNLAYHIVFNAGTDSYTIEVDSSGSWSTTATIIAPCDIVTTTLNSDTVIFTPQAITQEGSSSPTSIPTTPLSNDHTITLKATPSSSEQATTTIYKGTGLIE